jgi:benzoyl-CoA reductase subunit B
LEGKKMAKKKPKYKTAPLKIWNEAKSLRKNFFQEYVDVKKKGGIRILSATGISITFSSGIRDAVIMGAEPFAANTAFWNDFSLSCLEACERLGWSREICGYTKNTWGGALLDKYKLPDGSMVDWPTPDVMTSYSLAPCHNKWFQYLGEMKKIPFYLFDLPKVYPYNTESMLKYVSGQIMDYIEWLEKKTKRKFDDELFIECVKNETRTFHKWTEIMELNKTIPAPLDEKTIFSLVVPNLTFPYRKASLEFCERLLEEVQERVDKGIAAVENEQFRIITDAIPPWPYLSLWRWMEKEYGVVSIGSPYCIALAGSWMLDDEGTFIPVPTPEEKGMPLNTREEAVRALVWYKTHFATETLYTIAGAKIQHEMTVAVAKQWKIDGAILHLNRGCTMQALGGVGGKNRLVEEGIPAINYEGNDGDPRDLNMALTRRQIDAFLESNGVLKLKNLED